MRRQSKKEVQAVRFFTTIIRDSRRPVRRSATGIAMRLTTPSVVPPSDCSDLQVPVASWNHSLISIEETPKTFWEEEFGQSGTARAKVHPTGLEDRQVVGPSLLENTENSDLTKAPEHERSSPDIGKRKQTGLKNHRDAIVPSRMNRYQNLHGVVSFGKDSYSSKDPFVVKPVSKHPEQNARRKSVEATHRSRQADLTIRAGATTPPNPITRDRAASTPPRPVHEPVQKSAASDDDRISSSGITAPSETVALKTDGFQTKPLESQGAHADSPAVASFAGSGNDESPATQEAAAAEETVDAGQQTFAPSVPESATMAAGYDNISMRGPIKVSFTDEQATEPLDIDPQKEAASQTVLLSPVHEPGGPKVHIGLLEVVVLAPQNAPERKRSKSLGEHSFTSRHYLRNL